jgi:hypothetical protein
VRRRGVRKSQAWVWPRMTRVRLVALLVILALALVAGLALARPGGGESYSGGTRPSRSSSQSSSSRSSSSHSSSSQSSSNHSSSSQSSSHSSSSLPSSSHSSSGSGYDHSGGGGGQVDIGFVIELMALLVRYPLLGMMVVVGLGGFFYLQGRGVRGLTDWSTAMPDRVEERSLTASLRSELTVIRGDDPGFSLILFEDFVYALYAELQVSRARGGIGRLAAFLSPEVAQLLYDPALERVEGVVIGSLRYVGVGRGTERVTATLELEANLTELRPGQAQRYYVVDRLRLGRARAARSRPRHASKSSTARTVAHRSKACAARPALTARRRWAAGASIGWSSTSSA